MQSDTLCRVTVIITINRHHQLFVMITFPFTVNEEALSLSIKTGSLEGSTEIARLG